MTRLTEVKQLPLPGMERPPINEEFAIKIEAMVKSLTGEVVTLKKCLQLLAQYRDAGVLSDLDIHVMAELTRLELSVTAIRIQSTCDQLRTSTYILTAYCQTLADDPLSDMIPSIRDVVDAVIAGEHGEI